jgi:pimeloyl-ACP methyl ester carboxylesterase
VAVDLRGHGDSEWSAAGDYRIPAYVNDIVGLIGEVADGPAIVVGHSLGGIVALRTAIQAADRVRATVVIDIGPDSDKRFRDGFQDGKAGTAKRLASFMAMPDELESVEAFVQQSLAFNPRRNPESLRTSLMHNLRQLPNGNWAWKYDRRHYGKPQPDDATRNHWTDLEQVEGPVLVVRGGRSDILTEAGAQEFVALLPRARWASVPGAGHTVQGDNPAGLLVALRGFLEGLKIEA